MPGSTLGASSQRPGDLTSRRYPRARRLTSLLGVALALAAIAHTGAATASNAVRRCRSDDLRYPLSAGGPKAFGVFRLRIASGRCATAHWVAEGWMRRFEASFRSGRIRPPKSVDGFRFTNLPVRAAQTYRERGRRRTTSIWFDYVVPNG